MKNKRFTTASLAVFSVVFILFPVALVLNHVFNSERRGVPLGNTLSEESLVTDVLTTDPSPLLSLTSSAAPKNTSGKVLKVHIVPHTHDDVGWLKTVDQYYYGLNNTIQHATVKYILTTVIQALILDSRRKFTYVEIAYFQMWWKEQTPQMQGRVRKLVKDGQLVFVNGGWCMHDEAATHFMGMIDQTTRGHQFLTREFDGYTPRVGWQLDPFGHSSTQASYMSAEMGFDSLYFGRIDYQDLQKRHNTSQCEGVWQSSPLNFGTDAQVFWGLTGSYGGNYGPPNGFQVDGVLNDEPIVEGVNVDERMQLFLNALMWQANRTQGDHIMLTMGSDFQYENGLENFDRLDKLIYYTNLYSNQGKFDHKLLGDYTEIHAFYSDPATYTAAKFEEQETNPPQSVQKKGWQVKTDDFFPYSDCDHCFWTGYYTSRAALKRLERVGSSFLHAARQVEAMATTQLADCVLSPLDKLEDGVSILQHHDGVSGTSKQHVANDYAKRVDVGLKRASAYMADLLTEKFFGQSHSINGFRYCQLLNESKCELTQSSSTFSREAKIGQINDFYVLAYNPLGQSRNEVLSLPVSDDSVDYKITNLETKKEVESALIPNPNFSKSNGAAPFHLYFETTNIPPLGGIMFLVEAKKASFSSMVREQAITSLEDDTIDFVLSNNKLDVTFDQRGQLKGVLSFDSDRVTGISQDFGYYTSYAGQGQKSGAYIFRPNETKQELKLLTSEEFSSRTSSQIYQSRLVSEIQTRVSPWVKSVTRIKKGAPYIEFEYTVGPIPIEDGIGKEVVVRYSSKEMYNDGVFYTDSNGREFVKRRLSHRPTWDLIEYQPVAGNFFPVNAAIYAQDIHSYMTVLTDRSQGGTSLKNGTLDLMVHRRTVADDSRGVGEAMNETDGGMTPYPPFGKNERQGEGLVVTGTHRILAGRGTNGAAMARSQMDQAFSSVQLFFAPKNSQILRSGSFSMIQNDLPPNVMLITFMKLPKSMNEVEANLSSRYLVRLGHQYSKGEGPLGKAVKIDMKILFEKHHIKSIVEVIEEKTLSGNQSRESWENKRFHWQTSSQMQPSSSTACTPDGTTFLLLPMKICTFEVKLLALTTNVSTMGRL